MTISIISDEWQHFILLLHQISEQNTPTNKTGSYRTQNQHFTCQLNMSSMCPPAVALYAVTPDDDAIHRRSCRWMIAAVSAMPRQSLVSVRQLRRNFDDGRLLYLLKGTPDGMTARTMIWTRLINHVQIWAIRWLHVSVYRDLFACLLVV